MSVEWCRDGTSKWSGVVYIIRYRPATYGRVVNWCVFVAIYIIRYKPSTHVQIADWCGCMAIYIIRYRPSTYGWVVNWCGWMAVYIIRYRPSAYGRIENWRGWMAIYIIRWTHVAGACCGRYGLWRPLLWVAPWRGVTMSQDNKQIGRTMVSLWGLQWVVRLLIK